MNRYNPNDRYNQRFKDNMNRDFDRVRNGQQPEVRRQPFGKSDEKEEAEEEEEEEKAEMLLHINPYAATDIQIREAFCFDLTVLVKSFLSINFCILTNLYILFSVEKLHRDIGECSPFLCSLWIDSCSGSNFRHLCHCHHWCLLLCLLSHGQNSVINFDFYRHVINFSSSL